jgi:hypothetical protein
MPVAVVVKSPIAELPPIELARVVSLSEAAKLQGSSVDTIKREDRRRVARGERSRIVRLSERRVGMRLRDALLLGGETANTA